jgi:hypothetical protein
LRAAWILSLVFGVGVFRWSGDALEIQLLFLSIAGMVLVAVWALLGIRCPACGAKLLWRALRREDWLAWNEALTDLDKCPVCGFSGTDIAETADPHR